MFDEVDDTRLLDAEAGLQVMYQKAREDGLDTSEIVSTWQTLAWEMDQRALMYSPLDVNKGLTTGQHPGKKAMGTPYMDNDGDTDMSTRVIDDPDNDGGVSQGDKDESSENRAPTERQEPHPRSRINDTDGPTIKKNVFAERGKSGHSVGTFPDDGLRVKGKAKQNKSGEMNRTQDQTGDEDVDGDKDDKNDGSLGYIKAVNTSLEYVFVKDAGGATPHEFSPVINVCRVCRTHYNDHGDDHEKVPVRNVCRTCGQGMESHVSKATSLAVFKALPPLTDEERKQMAEQGVAMPDGSLPIPNEAFLHAAIGLLNQCPDPQSAMNHIIQRAQAMGLEHALPSAWNVQPAGQPGPPQVGPGANSLGSPAAPQTAGNAKPVGSVPGKPVPTGGPGPGGMGGGSSKPGGFGKWLHSRFAKSAEPDPVVELVEDFPYSVLKATGDEERYTMGPVYMPGQLDAHGEWVTAEDLHKSILDYSGGDRRIYLQHSDKPAGVWKELMCWPYEVRAQMTKSVNGVQKSSPVTFPAGTAYMGVIWEPWAWEMAKAQKITGFSIGGLAARVEGMPGQ